MSEDRMLPSYFTCQQAAALHAELSDKLCQSPGPRWALKMDVRRELLAGLTYPSGGLGSVRVEGTLVEECGVQGAGTINELVSAVLEEIKRDVECFPGECLLRGEDGKYYTVGYRVGVGEQSVGYLRQEIASDIARARGRNDFARVKAMRGHLAVLEARGRAVSEKELLAPFAWRFDFTEAEAKALSRFLEYGQVEGVRGPLASARTKLAGVLPASDGLVLGWACGNRGRLDGPTTAGEFAKWIREPLEENWMHSCCGDYLAEDGGLYSLGYFFDVVEACPARARGLVEGEMRLAREEGDDARVAALKPHLEALASLDASEEQASGREMAVIPTA